MIIIFTLIERFLFCSCCN